MKKNQTTLSSSNSNSNSSSLDHSPKTRRSKSREVSSRFLSPTTTTTETGGGLGISSPNQALSPIRRKITSHRGGIGGSLWPSSSQSKKLADHLQNERLKKDRTKDEKSSSSSSSWKNGSSLFRQRSCSEFSSRLIENEKESSKENHHPGGGGGGSSMRYTAKLRFPGKTSSSTKSSTSSSLLPGRLSVDDENSLSRRRSFRRRRRHSDAFFDTLSFDSGCSSSSSSTASSRRSGGIQVSSRYLHDQFTRTTRNGSCSTSSNYEESTSENSMQKKRVNSLMMGYGSATTQWALSPGRRRSGSPPTPSVENNKGKPTASYSSLKPPSSPSRSKGMGKNLLSFGLELFKSKKSSTSSPLGGKGIGDNAHQLRLLHNRLLQWRYVNARSDSLNMNKMAHAESNLINAWASISNLQSSVVQKQIQLRKEKLELKLNAILHSQIKPLETWGDIERQHLSAVSMTKDCLHSVVCRVPLIEGAKMDPQSASMAVRHSTDLTASIRTTLSNFSPTVEKMSSLLSELAEVVSTEKLLLEECLELAGMVSALEIQERSMKCNIVQMKIMQQQQLHQQPRQQEAAGLVA